LREELCHNSEQIVQELAERLFTSFETENAIDPLTESYPALSLEDAYEIQRAPLTHHLAQGRRVVGRKIGATSKEVQRVVCRNIFPCPDNNFSQYLRIQHEFGRLTNMSLATIAANST
jgi:hypothetical protein